MSEAVLSSATPPGWSLDPQLASDCIPVGDLALSRILLMNDANYPWLVLAPRRPGAVEIVDLAEADRALLMTEIAQVSGALRHITQCDKLNVAALGNAVRQLHVHVIARFHTDAAGMKPVWGQVPAKAYEPAEADTLIAAVRSAVAFA